MPSPPSLRASRTPRPGIASNTWPRVAPPPRRCGGRVIAITVESAERRRAPGGRGAARAAGSRSGGAVGRIAWAAGSRSGGAVGGTSRAAPVPGPAGGGHHDRQHGCSGHREESAGDPLGCADRQRHNRHVGGPAADQPGYCGSCHIRERWYRDDPVDGAGPDGAGSRCRAGDDEDAEDEAGFTAGQHGGNRAERGSADHDADPGSSGQRTPAPWRAAVRGLAPVRLPARAAIAPARSPVGSGLVAVRRARVGASWLGHLPPDGSRYSW